MSVPQARAQDIYYTKDNTVVCTTKSYVEKLTEYAASSDSAAFNGMVDGDRCTIIKGGVKVARVDVSWSGISKIRIFGTELELWTVQNSLEKR